MTENDLYKQLAEYLDQAPVGTPYSPSIIEILKTLFPEEEAEVALLLPMMNKTLSELKEMLPDKADSLEDILNRMVKRGTVFTSQKPGKERKYRLMPSVVGWAETPYWANKSTEVSRKLSPLWLKYREEAFGEELARNNMPVMRVVPVSKTLEDSREILPFDAIREKVESARYRAVAHCPCRINKKNIGEGCDYSLENCLHFGSFAEYMVEQGLAREITSDETLKILKEANEEGLVHIIDNIAGHMSTICNCCGCCCVFLETKKKTGLHTISTSNYVAMVSADDCIACGTCVDRCPMEAISIGDDEIAMVESSKCIGCGVCTPTCPSDAIDLSLRGEIMEPPEISDFLAARLAKG